MKQTAVDQLRDRLFKEFGFGYSDNIHDELKEIEAQQIQLAYYTGADEESDSHGAMYKSRQDALYYYISTYGK